MLVLDLVHILRIFNYGIRAPSFFFMQDIFLKYIRTIFWLKFSKYNGHYVKQFFENFLVKF